MRKGICMGAAGRRRAAPSLCDQALERADGELLAALDRDFQTAAEKARTWLRCAAGCTECCHGPFPITSLDSRRLARGLAELHASDPDRARRVLTRARDSVDRISQDYPGDVATGRLSEEIADLDRFFEHHENLACPVLDPETGLCDLYAWRPVACRTHGPPLAIGGEDVPPCRLCFVGARAETVEACRIEPDRQGLEEALLRAMGATGPQDWETVVAFALVQR